MPAGPRIRGNNSFGVTTDAPLTAGAVTFNSAGLATLPVVSSAHAVVVLDPKRVFGEPEIVVVTSHTALATVATITRGQYGTVARSHPVGTVWGHVPIDEDYIEVLTSATRPSNPYEGQFIFETDTNKLVGYGGVDWAPRDAGGQIGYSQAVANQAFTSPAVDITNLSVGVVVGTGRRIRISTRYYLTTSIAGDSVGWNILEGGTTLQLGDLWIGAAGRGVTGIVDVILTPTAGAHTYKVQGVRSAGSGTITNNAGATFPSYILVEDIGAA